jgi:NitT/TauT family transport system ATP-binding protein
MVTHNIDEAVMLADRIIILGSNPASVQANIQVPLPHPRDPESREWRQFVDHIYRVMIQSTNHKIRHTHKEKQIGLGYRLPEAEPSELSGLVETISSFENEVDLPELADELMMDVDDLFPIIETLEILGFAEIVGGRIQLKQLGKEFDEADLQHRKQIFAKRLLEAVPLARYIRRVLDEKPGHRVSEERFLSKLEDYLTEKESERVLRTMIDWGRYAELFAYDFKTGFLSLENPGNT